MRVARSVFSVRRKFLRVISVLFVFLFLIKLVPYGYDHSGKASGSADTIRDWFC